MSDYKFDPPVEVSVIPARKEELVEKKDGVGWTVRTVVGAEVFLSEDDLRANRAIKGGNALAPGTAVIVPTLFGYVRATVNTAGMAETEYSLYNLKYDEERGWVSDMGINKQALGKIELK